MPRTAEEILAEQRKLPELTRILLDWDDQVVELTLTTGQKVTGILGVSVGYQVAYLSIAPDEHAAYAISHIIGVRLIPQED